MPALRIADDEKTVSQMTLCPFTDGKPKQSCLTRECINCGVNEIPVHLKPLLISNQNEVVQYCEWKRVQKHVTTKQNEKIINITDKVTTPLKDLVTKMKTELLTFSAHIFRAEWQQQQLKRMKLRIPAKSAIVIMDFAENYSCTAQDEVQSAHWVNQSVTIHPMMAFINSSSEPGKITNKEAIIFISNDLKHDAESVAHFTSISHPHLKSSYGISHIEEFTDCCAQQYRCGKSFSNLSHVQTDLGLSVKHNYFEASHGKASADGLGAITKHAAQLAVTRRQYTIRNAEEFHKFCISELTQVGKSVYKSEQEKYADSSRTFFYVNNIDHSKKDRNVCTVKGTIKIHCAKGTGTPYEIKTRDLTCTCDFCSENIGTQCDNTEYVGEWHHHKLIPSNPADLTKKTPPQSILACYK